jgi:hypothetical protein
MTAFPGKPLSQPDVLSALYFRQIDGHNEKFGQYHPVWPESPIIHKQQ